MDKKNEILEMAEVMVSACDDCGDCEYHKYGNFCIEAQQAERLIESGYRKATDVRKETIRAMAQYLLDRMANAPLSDIELVKAYAFQCGVKVDE